MTNKQKLSILNLILTAVVMIAAIYYRDIMLGTVGMIFLIFSINRYKANFGI